MKHTNLMYSNKNHSFRKPIIQSDAFLVERKNIPFDQAVEENAKRETYRLASFKKCKIAVHPYSLAMAGFYHVGPGDRVRCFSCGSCVQSWKPNDDVSSSCWHTSDCKHFHQNNSENISIELMNDLPKKADKSFSTEPTQLQIGLDNNSYKVSKTDLQPLLNKTASGHPCVQRIAVIHSPVHQDLVARLCLNKESDRRKTFTGDWPVELSRLIEPLARTGFFYLGNADRAQCFSCGAVQRNWQPTDDVHKIHAERFKECRMIQNKEKRNLPLEENVSHVTTSSSTYPISFDLSSYHAVGPPPITSSSVNSLVTSSPSAHIYPSSLTLPHSSQSIDAQVRGPPSFISSQDDYVVTSTSLSTSLPLESSFITPNFSTDTGDVALNLPSAISEYTDVPFNVSTSSNAAAITTTSLSSINIPGHITPTTSPLVSIAGPPRAGSSPLPSAATIPHSIFSSPFHPVTLSSTGDRNANLLPPFLAEEGGNTSSSLPANIPTNERSNVLSVEQQVPSSSSGANGAAASVSWLIDLDPFAPRAPQETPLPLSELDVIDNVFDVHTKALLRDMYPCQQPDNREMVSLGLRISTFRLPWPDNSSVSTVTETAEAGFYYLGSGDHVRCWYCGVEAKNWSLNQDAWSMHATLYPSCQYLLRNKGSEFVESKLNFQSAPGESGSLLSHQSWEDIPASLEEHFTVAVESGPDRLPTPPIIDPRVESEEKKAELRRAMQSTVTHQAVSMGFTRNHIRQVVKKQIDQHSCNFQTLEALIDELIFTPENLIDLNSSESSDDGQSSNQDRDNELVELDELDDDIELYRGSIQGNVPPDDEETAEVDDFSSSSLLQESSSESQSVNSKEKEAELRRLQEEKRCKVCLDRDANLVFVPCGHICACEQCTHLLKQCPLCRQKIEKAYKTYSS